MPSPPAPPWPKGPKTPRCSERWIPQATLAQDPSSQSFQLGTGSRKAGLLVLSSYQGFWHLAISCIFRRPTDAEILEVLKDFDATSFGERQTGPRNFCRHFFYPPMEDEKPPPGL